MSIFCRICWYKIFAISYLKLSCFKWTILNYLACVREWVSEWERERVCVCVCVCEREWEAVPKSISRSQSETEKGEKKDECDIRISINKQWAFENYIFYFQKFNQVLRGVSQNSSDMLLPCFCARYNIVFVIICYIYLRTNIFDRKKAFAVQTRRINWHVLNKHFYVKIFSYNN